MGSQSSASFSARRQLKRSFWLRRRSDRTQRRLPEWRQLGAARKPVLRGDLRLVRIGLIAPIVLQSRINEIIALDKTIPVQFHMR